MLTFLAILAAYLYSKITMILITLSVGVTYCGMVYGGLWMHRDIYCNKRNDPSGERLAWTQKWQKWHLKLGIALGIVLLVTPSTNTIKIMAAAGGVAWVIQDEGVQNVATAVANQTTSAATASIKTIDLGNQVIQRMLMDKLKAE